MKAFILVEVLVSVAILAILMAGIGGVFMPMQRAFQDNMGLVDLQQNIRQVMDGMVREIRQSRPGAIQIPSPRHSAPSIAFSTPGSSSLIHYYLSNHQIIREHPDGTTRIIANNIGELNFCRWNDTSGSCCSSPPEVACNLNSIQIQLRAAKTVLNRRLQFPLEDSQTVFDDLLTEKVRLRNE
jgi:type II secretory pathway pseudopilin PulG